MIKDYSDVPAVKKITNNTDEDIILDLRDILQIPAEIKVGESLSITVKTSEGLAILAHKVEDLKLDMESGDEPTPEPEPEPVEVDTEEALISAIEDAEDGAVIALSNNMTISEPLSLNKNITIDVGENTLDLGSTALHIEEGGDVTLKGSGKISSADKNVGLNINSGKLTIDGVTVESTKLYGIGIDGTGELVMNSGEIHSKDSCIGLNNTTCDKVKITINGGTLTSDTDATMYLPGPCEVIVNDGILNGGISARMGDVTINGGTINSISSGNDLIEEYYAYSGNVWLGDAIACMAGTYKAREAAEGETNDLNININGGTINGLCNGCSAVTIYNLGVVEQNIAVTIKKNATLTVADEEQPVYKVVPATEIVPEGASNYDKYTAVVNTVVENIEE